MSKHSDFKREARPRSDLANPRNYILHGLFFLFYAVVKYWSFPFSNLLRFVVIRAFGGDVQSTYIADGVTIWFPWRVKIGRDCSLNQGVNIDGYGGVSLGNGVRIAAYVCINSSDHDFSQPDIPIREQGMVTAPVVIEDDVWIGNHVVINRGVHIGRGSVIGSSSVVTRDIPPYSIAVGAPCRVIRSRKSAID